MTTEVRKSGRLAFLYSFVLPGAGLVYLGKWRAGAVNLAIAILLPVLAVYAMPDGFVDHIHYLLLVIAAGSGAFAHAQSE